MEKIEKLLKSIMSGTKGEQAKILLGLDNKDFELAKRIFIESTVKIAEMPCFDKIFNIKILKNLNTEQLQFLQHLINKELEGR